MARKRIAEKNQKIAKAIHDGNAIVSRDENGRRKVNLLNNEKKQVRRNILGTRILYNCPKCGKVLEFRKKMHQGLCMKCGQALNWADYDNMPCVCLRVNNSDEAAYWAGQYESICGTLYGISIDKWRLEMTRKSYPMLLYFPFIENKDYGRFMRKAAKEGSIVKEI